MNQFLNNKSSHDLIIFLVILILVIGMVTNPSIAINSAREGLYNWFNILVPALFPFLFFSELLILSGFINILGNLLEPLMNPIFRVSGQGAFPLLISLVSGYPIGAKLTSSLRGKKIISKTEANRLITFSSTSGPLFILGAVAVGMLNNKHLAHIMIIPHYLGTLTVGLIFRYYKNDKSKYQNHYPKNIPMEDNQNKIRSHKLKQTLASNMAQSIQDATSSILIIGGYIIIYSVIIELILSSKIISSLLVYISNIFNINSKILAAIVSGFIELSIGCKKISSLNIHLIHKLFLLNFFIGWAGFSIQNQAINFINKTDINQRLFIFSRFLHGIIASIYTYIIYVFKYKVTNIPLPVLLPNEPGLNNALNWLPTFFASCKLVLFTTLYILVLGISINILLGKNKKRAD